MDLIFGTPLWKINSNSFDEKKITEEILSVQKSDPDGMNVSNIGGYHSKDDIKIPLVDEYIKDMLEGEEGLNFPHEVTGKWFNINGKGSSNKPHRHGFMGLSGVLFITDAPGLILQNDDLFSPDILDNNNESFTHGTLKIDGEPGQIVVFPSTVLHWVEPNESDTPRITFAFNIRTNKITS